MQKKIIYHGEIHNLLYKYYGFDNFRPGQEDIIKTIIAKKDTLAILPTGGGKSLCYQIPGLYFPNLTIVISPLIALMKDQVDSLNKRNISAAYLSSTLENREIEQIINNLKNNKYKFLYIAPERLETKNFIHVIKNIKVDLVAIDECHCISMWGHDFRPSYLNILKFINLLRNKPVIAAFTATATKKTILDIKQQLNLYNSRTYINSFRRNNLTLKVTRTDEHLKEKLIIEKLHSHDKLSLIFANSRIQCERLANICQQSGTKASFYHAGLDRISRTQIQNEFMQNKYDVIFATNAFGMGIDKPDIRYVYHLGFPGSIEDYYQEAGRAGRDQKNSVCEIIYSFNDIKKRFDQLNIVEGENSKLFQWRERQLQAMVDYLITDKPKMEYILNYFGEKV